MPNDRRRGPHARQPVAGEGGPAVLCPWCKAPMQLPPPDVAALAPARLFCAAGCAVECDELGRRWTAEGRRVRSGAAFPVAPARPSPALPLPADWQP